ncbi:MAG: proline--tRNA ligase [Anaerolineae bacterium]|nr:proline--tRNA ligase [Anaerolineae bacterium]MDW8070341.1 proline--tRNA ligase [Anaerolineae bacterium]
MRLSQMLFQTMRQASTDIMLPGYQYLQRGGFVRSVSGGAYVFLPLGVQVRRQLQRVLAHLMEEWGGQEIGLPALQPLEVIEGQAEVTFPDWAAPLQHAVSCGGEGYRTWTLPSSHEQLMLALARNIIQSYRQLPVLLYLFWQAPEPAMRTALGLLAGRESMVLDAYSFHSDEADRNTLCQSILTSWADLAERADMPVHRVIADLDDEASRLIWPWRDGDHSFLICDACRWACDQAIAPVRKPVPPAEAAQPLREVATPDCKTIAALCSWLRIPPSRTAKSLFLVAEEGGAVKRHVIAVVRGDTELSVIKLKRLLGMSGLRPATEEEIRTLGAEPGYGSPVGISAAEVVVDQLVVHSSNLVAGANRAGYHLLNVNYGRDYQATYTADIAMAQAGDLCPSCATPLQLEHGIELGIVGGLRPEIMQAHHVIYLDPSGIPQPVMLGRHRFYMDRFIAATGETHHDAMGLIWPTFLAPYDVYLMTLGRPSSPVSEVADTLYTELHNAGVRVLYDDRDERAGVKFYDADLIGLPLRVVIGERDVAEGMVEVKRRCSGEVVKVAIPDVVTWVKGAL